MSQQNRERRPINLDIKKEIISKQECGNSVGDLSAKYGTATSRISTILRKQRINEKCTGRKGNLWVKQLNGNFALGCGPGMD